MQRSSSLPVAIMGWDSSETARRPLSRFVRAEGMLTDVTQNRSIQPEEGLNTAVANPILPKSYVLDRLNMLLGIAHLRKDDKKYAASKPQCAELIYSQSTLKRRLVPVSTSVDRTLMVVPPFVLVFKRPEQLKLYFDELSLAGVPEH